MGSFDSRSIDFKHFVCARAQPVGRQSAGNGNGRGDADDGHAHRFHARRGAPIRRRVSLLSRAKLRRHGHDVHEATELRRTRFLLSLALRSNNGTIALVVPEELLPLLHGRSLSDLSRTGSGSVFQTRTGRSSFSTQSARPDHG